MVQPIGKGNTGETSDNWGTMAIFMLNWFALIVNERHVNQNKALMQMNDKS